MQGGGKCGVFRKNQRTRNVVGHKNSLPGMKCGDIVVGCRLLNHTTYPSGPADAEIDERLLTSRNIFMVEADLDEHFNSSVQHWESGYG